LAVAEVEAPDVAVELPVEVVVALPLPSVVVLGATAGGSQLKSHPRRSWSRVLTAELGTASGRQALAERGLVECRGNLRDLVEDATDARGTELTRADSRLQDSIRRVVAGKELGENGRGHVGARGRLDGLETLNDAEVAGPAVAFSSG
jgi:hypothetical protein